MSLNFNIEYLLQEVSADHHYDMEDCSPAQWECYSTEKNTRRNMIITEKYVTYYNSNIVCSLNGHESSATASVAESEVNSVVESLFTQSSRGSGIKIEPSSEERRLEQRQKQIDYGKNTIGYQKYTMKVPRVKRKYPDPETPVKSSKCSKRAWDGLVRSWRRKLHQYDPPEGQNNNGL